MQELVGKSYTFDDGNKIKVIQIKVREVDNISQPYVMFEISHTRSLPKRLVMTMNQFVDAYGHLFGLSNQHTD
jgi:hypothetical protein